MQQLQKLDLLQHAEATLPTISHPPSTSEHFIKPSSLKYTRNAPSLLQDIDISLSSITKELTLNFDHMTDHVTSCTPANESLIKWREDYYDDAMEWTEEGGATMGRTKEGVATNCLLENSIKIGTRWFLMNQRKVYLCIVFVLFLSLFFLFKVVLPENISFL